MDNMDDDYAEEFNAKELLRSLDDDYFCHNNGVKIKDVSATEIHLSEREHALIRNPEVLLSFGVSKEEVKRLRKEIVKRVYLTRLCQVVKAIEDDDAEKLDGFMRYSPAGDGMGSNNCYISFPLYGAFSDEDISAILPFLRNDDRVVDDF